MLPGFSLLNVKRLFASFLGLLFCAIFLTRCNSMDKFPISRPMFSPDNSTLIFTYCAPRENCTIGTYHLSTKEFRTFQPPQDESWFDPAYSPDGKNIVFTMVGEGGRFTRQIAVMRTDGSERKNLTASPTFKGNPTFSADGRKIIYAVGHSTPDTRNEKSSSTKPITGMDIYEIGPPNWSEKPLTFHGFFSVSRPYYLPDGITFVFAADGMSFPNAKDNRIYILKGGRIGEMRPAFMNDESSFGPSVSLDGSRILFVSRTNELDDIKGQYNYDLFLREEGANKRLTKLGAYMRDSVISMDGSRIVFVISMKREQDYTIWVMNSDGSDMQEVKIDGVTVR